MNRVIESSVDPLTALAVGLKVDVDALPAKLIKAIKAGQVDLTDPATTVALIKLNAVVGVVGKVRKIQGEDHLTSVGITCALCHSTVDDSLMPGIGRRLDGWPNPELDPGKIIALSPAVPDEAKAVYNSWGPGKYDPRFNIDGLSTPLVIPPAYGLARVAKETYTAEGPISYWNDYVAVTQMGGHGSFSDPRLGINIVQTARPGDAQAATAARLSVQPPDAACRPGGVSIRSPRDEARPCSKGPATARAATSRPSSPT